MEDDDARRRMLWLVLLAILTLIVFWLVLRFWHMWHAGPPKPPEQAEFVGAVWRHSSNSQVEHRDVNAVRRKIVGTEFTLGKSARDDGIGHGAWVIACSLR